VDISSLTRITGVTKAIKELLKAASIYWSGFCILCRFPKINHLSAPSKKC
jgi:hypothetical protein